MLPGSVHIVDGGQPNIRCINTQLQPWRESLHKLAMAVDEEIHHAILPWQPFNNIDSVNARL